jgi:phosphopantothenoylcysteine decarboxylase/phosphopantothenate--cysteine ligase
MRILITAGGTREYIDPVRFISNASSGRMGYELARAALKSGHEVTLITTVIRQTKIVNQAAIVKVETAAEMFSEVKKHFRDCDCLIMAAAVADYTPARKSKIKIKKHDSELIINLKPTMDILKWAGKHKSKLQDRGFTPQIVVGFALEDKNMLENAEKKLKEKNLDIVVANNISAIGSEESSIYIKTPDTAWQKIEETNKTSTAKRIVKLIEAVFSTKS